MHSGPNSMWGEWASPAQLLFRASRIRCYSGHCGVGWIPSRPCPRRRCSLYRGRWRYSVTWRRLLSAGYRYHPPINVTNSRVVDALQLLGIHLQFLRLALPIHLVSMSVFSAAYLNSAGAAILPFRARNFFLGAMAPPFSLASIAFNDTGGVRIAEGTPGPTAPNKYTYKYKLWISPPSFRFLLRRYRLYSSPCPRFRFLCAGMPIRPIYAKLAPGY